MHVAAVVPENHDSAIATTYAKRFGVPVADEADRAVAKGAREWPRVNASRPFVWSNEGLLEEIAEDS